MSLYFFRISTGRYSGAADQPYEFEDRAAAWTEMTEVCANLLGSIARNLKPNAKWSMELLDENKKPVFRVSLVGETLCCADTTADES
ncbi:hypothetical protein KUL72_27835 [Bradyrhizobium arachidis]|uniref:DUF6894 family protein n=1 Tax=Bradyrhizobium TaxID=374 RepID=UPI00188D570A|nr:MULTISPECIES: hypothetical protein [Bradyrhizobium]MDN4988611.1 hypothetical protein [Bradyrhizobium sp. WYCCWR 13022]QOZ54594.1 hypothetical protein XH90_26875 [Bradyrhizobium sp. CCBAU 53338]UVO35236.1 hypothetical protein KUL72_27835 [Bradyrhizobium arachidis]